MHILAIYGPNLNLLGVISRRSGERLTLDKLNKAFRQLARELDVELKILQTQSEIEASKIIQKQRNKVQGVMLIPGVWARTGYLLRETIEVTDLPLAVFYMEPKAGPWSGHENSIFKEAAALEAVGSSREEATALLERFVTSLTA
jgi:3-dehydroquinate dehydratase